MELFQLVYVSKAIPTICNQDILDILATARRFNSKNRITGCLVFFNHQFLQVLEGDKQIVSELFENVQSDSRHYEVSKISTEKSLDRTFPEWNMAFHSLNEDDISKLKKKLFVENLSNLTDLAYKPTESVQLFWNEVIQMLMIERVKHIRWNS